MGIREAALEYCAKGLAVTPLDGKRPILKGWQQLPVAKAADIRAWDWRRGLNIGLRTGKASGLDGIDLDGPGGVGAWNELCEAHAFFYTGPICITPRQGRHLYFPHDPRITNSRGQLKGRGIDVRGEGGQLVLPPSIHPETKTEYYFPAGRSLLECAAEQPWPDWLIELLAGRAPAVSAHRAAGERIAGDPAHYRYARRALDNERMAVASAMEGSRNQTLNNAALALGSLCHLGAFTEDEAHAALAGAGVACGLDHQEIEATFKSGWRAGLANPRQVPERGTQLANYVEHQRPLSRPNGEGPGDNWHEPAVSHETSAAPAGKGKARVKYEMPSGVTADLLARKTFAPVNWVVEKLLPEGLAILAGKSKIGKSWGLLSLAYAVATGTKWLGHYNTTPGGVLYLALEDNERRLQSRLDTMLGDEAARPKNLDFRCSWYRCGVGCMELLEEYLQAHPGCRLVIIDTFGRVRGEASKNKQAYQQDVADVAAFSELANKYHVAILMSHHTRKQEAEDVFDLVSGTTGIVGTSDTIWVLTRKRGENIATLAITGRDIIDDADLALKFDRETGVWTSLGNAQVHEDKTVRDQIIAYLTAADGSVSVSDMAEDLNRSSGTLRKILSRLKSERPPVVKKAGRRLWVLASKNPKREEPDDHEMF